MTGNEKILHKSLCVIIVTFEIKVINLDYVKQLYIYIYKELIFGREHLSDSLTILLLAWITIEDF